MWEDFPFPIFLVANSSSVESVYQCWEHHNKEGLQWPACSLELKGNMYAAKDSSTCLRRSQLFTLTPVTRCDGLSDDSLHYTVKARNSTTADNSTIEQKEKSVIVVSARMDALTMFDKAEVGFDSPSTGIVTLLATAKLVSESLRSQQFVDGIENVLFLLIHGESFDYIGSSRLLYDMNNDAFPYNLSRVREDDLYYRNGTQPLLNVSHIHSWLELGQLSPKSSEYVYLHSENTGDLVTTLRESAGPLTTIHSRNLPPASVQTFIKAEPTIPNVLISNFENSYSNKMFHSIFDSATYQGFNETLGGSELIPTHLARVAAMLAKTVNKMATGRELSIPDSSTAELINSMLSCYTVTANCSLWQESSSPGVYPWSLPPQFRQEEPFPQYVGVRGSPHTLMTKLLLQYLTGEIVQIEAEGDVSDSDDVDDLVAEKDACHAMNSKQAVYSYAFIVGEGCSNVTDVQCAKCYRTTVWSTEASSPAFLEEIIDGYDWSSGTYPTWTESIWKTIEARVFLRANPSRDWGTLALGLVISLLAIPSVWWMDKHAAALFGDLKAGDVSTPVTM